MRKSLFRQLRAVVLIVAGIGTLTTLVAMLFVFWSEKLQQEFLDNLVTDEYHELLEHLEKTPEAALPRAAMLRIWIEGHPASEDVPYNLQILVLGTHHEVPIEDKVFHVLKADTDGLPTYVAIELSGFSERERWLKAALFIVALLDVPLALFMGIWLVRRISIPHEKLAKRVQALDPAKEPMHLGGEFAGLEIERVAQAIDQYQDRLQGFVERERAFTAAASHELRTPLTSMLTSAEVLHHNDRLQEDLKPYTSSLISTGLRMGEILDGLMWFSRETEIPETRMVDVEVTIRDLVRQMSNETVQIDVICESAQKDHNIELPEALFVIVVSNLLQNACRHSEEDSRVAVVISGRAVSITNAGEVIPESELPLLSRYGFRSAQSKGQGLGLYIASNISRSLGWDLQISSGPEGTTVKLAV